MLSGQTKPELKLSGRSGCRLEVIGDRGEAQVRKYSNSVAYNTRLTKQAEKQILFKSLNLHPAFDSPAIKQISPVLETELSWFEMDFIYAEKYSDYLERCSINEIKHIFQNFLGYFAALETNAVYSNLEETVFHEKLEEVSDKIRRNHGFHCALCEKVIRRLEAVPTGQILVGFCHGDLTFSNILFGHEKIFYVDFLDSFIESPIIDLVKLRQDTLFGWSLHLERSLPAYRQNKLKQIFCYLDGRFENYINERGFAEWYDYLEIFNLFRILPYVSDAEEIQFVKNCLLKTKALCT